MSSPEPGLRLISLTQPQILRLLLPWDHQDCGVRLNGDLPVGDLAGARRLGEARVLLLAAAEAGGVQATARGNLCRAFVAATIPQVVTAEEAENMQRYCKVVNERDVRAVHIPRVLLGLAGLLLRRKGVFSVTKKGHGLLPDERAGALVALLFTTYFRKFNLAYLDYMEESEHFQQLVGLSLYLVGQLGDGWWPVAEIANLLGHPLMMDYLPPQMDERRFGWMLQARLLRPLEDFGLLECRDGQEPHTYEVRKTPLFDRFLSFEPGPGE